MLRTQVRQANGRNRPAEWRSRQFLITWAQCDVKMDVIRDELRGRFGEEAIDYIVVSEEHHENGDPHRHACIKFKEVKKVKKDAFDIIRDAESYHANIESVRGNGRKAIEYVRKDGVWCDYGNDPLTVAKMTREEKMNFVMTHTANEIVESGRFTVFEVNAALRMKDALSREKITWPIFRKRVVHWYYGATGSGKTRVAMRRVTQFDSWAKLNGTMKSFVNGYHGERAVVIDDLRAGSVDFEILLAMLDGYPCVVNVKGGYVEWKAEFICLTAPKRPEEIFYDHQREQPWDKVDQLLRRIDILRDFDEIPYGAWDDDLDTVVLPVYGPELPPEPEIVPEEAELIEEEEFSTIPGTLAGDFEIIDGVVHPLFGVMPKFK